MKDFDLKKYLREGKLYENNEYKESINITPQQKSDFINQIKSFMEDEDFNTAMRNAGSILARILTNDEAEFIEDVEDFGYDPSEVEDYAEDLVGNLNRGKLQENEDASSKKQQLVQLLSFPSNFDTKLMQAARIAMDLRFEEDFDYEKLSQDLESIAESYDFHDLSNQLEDWASSIPMSGGTGLS